jgi:hypothetical protein
MVEVHIKVVDDDDDGASDLLVGTYRSLGAAHDAVQEFFTDLQLREKGSPWTT